MTVQGIFTPIKNSRTLRRVALLACVVAAYSLLPVWKEHSIYRDLGDMPSELYAALTLVLGWLLVFKTNAAYNRWWEARTLWGALVNASRNLALKTAVMIDLPEAELFEVKRHLNAFPYAVKDHLRDMASLNVVPGFETAPDKVIHVPGFIASGLYGDMRRWRQAGWVDGDLMRVIDHDLSRLMDICGGCERIKSTRITTSYRVFVRQCVVLFLVLFPWGIAQDFGWWTVLVTGIIAYFMLGLGIVAENIEEPFGFDEDDLDLDRLCHVISASVDEIFERRGLREKSSPAASQS